MIKYRQSIHSSETKHPPGSWLHTNYAFLALKYCCKAHLQLTKIILVQVSCFNDMQLWLNKNMISQNTCKAAKSKSILFSQQWIICSSYLPALVMIISVPTSSNFVQSSLSWRKTLIPSIPCSKIQTVLTTDEEEVFCCLTHFSFKRLKKTTFSMYTSVLFAYLK